MINKNTKDGNRLNSLLSKSKLFCVCVFFLVQSFKAQITVGEGAIFYSEKEIVIHQEEKSSPISSAKIYVSSQAQISNGHLISGDIEVIDEIDSKKEKDTPKAVVLKEPQEPQEAKIAKVDKIAPQKVDVDTPIFNSLESSTSIVFNKTFSEKIVSASSFQFKHFINKEFFASSNWFVSKELKSINLSVADFFCNIYSLTFLVRPPPFLV